MQVTTRVDVKEIDRINWSLDDITKQLGRSSNPRVRAAVKTLELLPAHITAAVGLSGDTKKRPKVVCLCGSTRFWKQFQEASLRETLEGKIVLSVGAAVASDDEHFGHMEEKEKAAVKAKLDELHLRKIDLADEVLILNVGQYIGESTGRELDYAQKRGKTIRFLEPIEDRLSDEEIKETVEAFYSTDEGERELEREEAEFAGSAE